MVVIDFVSSDWSALGVVRVQCSGVVRGHCRGTAFCLPRLFNFKNVVLSTLATLARNGGIFVPSPTASKTIIGVNFSSSRNKATSVATAKRNLVLRQLSYTTGPALTLLQKPITNG